jgi:hypothetical protein
MNNAEGRLGQRQEQELEALNYRTFARRAVPGSESRPVTPLTTPAQAAEDNSRLFEPQRAEDPERWDGMS